MAQALGLIGGAGGGGIGVALASVIGNAIGIARQVLEFLMNLINRIITWMGEHPEAGILTLVNLMIWMSP